MMHDEMQRVTHAVGALRDAQENVREAEQELREARQQQVTAEVELSNAKTELSKVVPELAWPGSHEMGAIDEAEFGHA